MASWRSQVAASLRQAAATLKAASLKTKPIPAQRKLLGPKQLAKMSVADVAELTVRQQQLARFNHPVAQQASMLGLTPQGWKTLVLDLSQLPEVKTVVNDWLGLEPTEPADEDEAYARMAQGSASDYQAISDTADGLSKAAKTYEEHEEAYYAHTAAAHTARKEGLRDEGRRHRDAATQHDDMMRELRKPSIEAERALHQRAVDLLGTAYAERSTEQLYHALKNAVSKGKDKPGMATAANELAKLLNSRESQAAQQARVLKLQRKFSARMAQGSADDAEVDRSADETVVEYAIREVHKNKTPKQAALATTKKLSGGQNMMLGSGTTIVDPKKLEDAIWGRFLAKAKFGASRGWDDEVSADSALQVFYTGFDDKSQALRAKLVPELVKRMKGHKTSGRASAVRAGGGRYNPLAERHIEKNVDGLYYLTKAGEPFKKEILRYMKDNSYENHGTDRQPAWIHKTELGEGWE